MGDVGFDRLVALVDDRAGAHRPLGHPRSGIHAAVRVFVNRQELGAVAAVGKAREHDFAGLGPLRRRVVEAGSAEIEAAEAIEAIAPPRPVVDLVAHRLAELAVARDVDADVLLLADNVDHGRLPASCRTAASSLACAGFARAVGFDQIVRSRQAARLARENVIPAHTHGFSERRKTDDRGRRENAHRHSVAVVCRSVLCPVFSDGVERLVSFTDATRPWNTSLTGAQLGSFFMLLSQRWTFG